MKIVLADDHQLVRQCLRTCLSSYPNIEVVGEASDGATAVSTTLELKPDVLVVDIQLPVLNGTEVTRQVVAVLGSRCRVLALSMHGTREFVAEMFRAGASGYVVKSAAYDELVAAIEAVTAGKRYVSPAVAGVLVDAVITPSSRANPDEPHLTPREREVLTLVAGGLNTKEIAARLVLSDKTVHALRGRLLRKLGMQGVADLTRYAIRRGYAAVDGPRP